MRLLMPSLSIVIVSYNSRRDLDGCLTSLTTSGRPAIDHEIVVVDNASRDDTPAYLRERWPGVRLIEAGRNAGFSAANNIGIRQTFGEFVLLLNPDTLVGQGALDRLVHALQTSPAAAVVGPRLVDAEGRAELSFGRMISPANEFRQKLLVVGQDRQWPIVSPMVERMTRVPRRVDWVSGACLLIRRTDLDAVGLLDERFFMYTEDVDLCASVRQRGREVLFEPSAEVVHLRGRSRATASAATARAYRQSQLAFYAKHRPYWVPWLRFYLRLRGIAVD